MNNPQRYDAWYALVDGIRSDLVKAIDAQRKIDGWWPLEQLGGSICEYETYTVVPLEFAQMAADMMAERGINFTGSIYGDYSMKFAFTMRENMPQIGDNYWALILSTVISNTPDSAEDITISNQQATSVIVVRFPLDQWDTAKYQARAFARKLKEHNIEGLVSGGQVNIYREMQIP